MCPCAAVILACTDGVLCVCGILNGLFTSTPKPPKSFRKDFKQIRERKSVCECVISVHNMFYGRNREGEGKRVREGGRDGGRRLR